MCRGFRWLILASLDQYPFSGRPKGAGSDRWLLSYQPQTIYIGFGIGWGCDGETGWNLVRARTSRQVAVDQRVYKPRGQRLVMHNASSAAPEHNHVSR